MSQKHINRQSGFNPPCWNLEICFSKRKVRKFDKNVISVDLQNLQHYRSHFNCHIFIKIISEAPSHSDFEKMESTSRNKKTNEGGRGKESFMDFSFLPPGFKRDKVVGNK